MLWGLGCGLSSRLDSSRALEVPLIFGKAWGWGPGAYAYFCFMGLGSGARL